MEIIVLKTKLIGDIHGMAWDYKLYSIGDFNGPTIQVGDFGIGMGQSDYWHESINDFHSSGKHRFIRGNHDNPHICKKMTGWIPDGTVENDVMFIGGAWSIDNPKAPPGWYRRSEGYDWWPEEECSDEEFERMFDIYKTVRPRVMITHDCPASISYLMFWGHGLVTGDVYENRTSKWFDKFFSAHQPNEWYFGHWHHTLAYQSGKTRFQCIGELDTIEVDL